MSIGEVLTRLEAEFPDVTVSKIRYLESRGLLEPERSPAGYRRFSVDDVARLTWILRQQREHFLPLKVIRSILLDGVDVTAVNCRSRPGCSRFGSAPGRATWVP